VFSSSDSLWGIFFVLSVFVTGAAYAFVHSLATPTAASVGSSPASFNSTTENTTE